MDQRLQEILDNREENCLLPFLWLKGESHEQLVAEIEAIARSGARAFCVESRPHKQFCREGWWADMDLILAEAERRGMQVWILDDKHFPTGYANGLIKDKYPERRIWHLREEHVDVVGPQAEGAVMLSAPVEGEELLWVYALPRPEYAEVMAPAPVELTGRVRDGYVFWDIPHGVHRIFFIYKTRRGGLMPDYIHMIDRDSVQTLIEAVYEPHHARYKRYFGSTLAGFFSDEPLFGNDFVNWSGATGGFYDRRIGKPGLALPWTDEVLARMSAALGQDARPLLPALWYGIGEPTPAVRVAYMDAVTLLWREHFSFQLGEWCRARGVQYIGHIIEDNHSHARLGWSGGHYFRSLDGQDMAGIDVVLHQIIPGLGRHLHTTTLPGGCADARFYNCVLAKLAASHAHLQPLKQGRAMCEVFGAYGWAEGAPMMKGLIDHLLVRGINRFVPHAFSPTFPDPDCPPHFYGAGYNPQFDAFAKLMGYTNKVSHLFEGTLHLANAAILYHAEAEWSGRPYQLLDEPAAELYERQIDFDIVCLDMLAEATVTSGKLRLHRERFDCLVVPYAAWLPPAGLARLAELYREGLPLIFVDGRPEGVAFGSVVPLAELAQTFVTRGWTDLRLDHPTPLLRAYHAVRGETHLFMFCNESESDPLDTIVTVGCRGRFARLDLLLERKTTDATDDGRLPLRLAPGQSTIVVFDAALPDWPAAVPAGAPVELASPFSVSRASYLEPDDFRPVDTAGRLQNMTGPRGDASFSGLFRYETTFDLPAGIAAAVLDLGVVGQAAQVSLNGVDLGWRICRPYEFDTGGALRPTGNRLTVTVANTLVHALRDGFSHFLQIPPSGLLGPVRVLPTRGP